MVMGADLSNILASPVRELPLQHDRQRRLSAAEADELVGLYRDDTCSTYDLAERFGINRETVARLLKARGLIVGQRPLNNFEKEQIETLRAKGLSANAIGLHLGRDPKTVRGYLGA